MAPSAPIIGIDPHKRSHTAVVIDDCEEIIAQLRVDASSRQVDQLLAWAPPDPARVWAVENAHGMGHLLAQQLIGRGETVVDVPATMAARARKLSGKSARKSDPQDARSVAITAAHNRGLHHVLAEDLTDVIGLLLDRRWQLVTQRQRLICQLHATLAELTPAGAKRHLTCDKAAVLLRGVRPLGTVDLTRKAMATEMLADWRWLNRRIPPAEERLAETLVAHGTTLTTIYGIADIGAATILAIVGDVSRFPTAGHFAAFCGTAPLEASSGEVVRHRLSRRGDRQMNKVLHVAATCQARNTGPGRVSYLRKVAEGNGKLELPLALWHGRRTVELLNCERAESGQRDGPVGLVAEHRRHQLPLTGRADAHAPLPVEPDASLPVALLTPDHDRHLTLVDLGHILGHEVVNGTQPIDFHGTSAPGRRWHLTGHILLSRSRALALLLMASDADHHRGSTYALVRVATEASSTTVVSWRDPCCTSR